MAADAVRASEVPGPAAPLPAPDWEAAGVWPGSAEEAVAERANVTADGADAVPEVPGDAELVDTDAGTSGDDATVVACACRESSSKTTQMAAATRATRTV